MLKDRKDNPAREKAMSDEFVELIKHRVETRYYDQPHVRDAVARAVADDRAPREESARN